MVSRLSGVYLLSFYLIGLNAGSMPNLCSITSLGISDISDICHEKTSRFSQRKLTSMSSYLASSSVLRRSFLLVSSGSTTTSLYVAPFFLSSAGECALLLWWPEYTADRWFEGRCFDRSASSVCLGHLCGQLLYFLLVELSGVCECGVLTC
jgi:hypothetical protein